MLIKCSNVNKKCFSSFSSMFITHSLHSEFTVQSARRTIIVLLSQPIRCAETAASYPPAPQWLLPAVRGIRRGAGVGSQCTVCTVCIVGNMSACILLKTLQTVNRRSLGVLRTPLVCTYHTERGVYGYRPRREGSEEADTELQALSERLSSLNQGQHSLAQFSPKKSSC